MFDALIIAATLYVNKPAPTCTNPLVIELREAGFRGQNLKEAWAIAMRESHGRERAISRTGDYGLFQINKAAHGKNRWWNDKKMLSGTYNAEIAHYMSNGGKNWSAWDITGDGQYIGNYSPKSVFLKFKEWLKKYPC